MPISASVSIGPRKGTRVPFFLAEPPTMLSVVVKVFTSAQDGENLGGRTSRRRFPIREREEFPAP